MFILSCLVTILFSVYGNYLIDKLSLEEKYPKLGIFIKLRVKLINYYILINALLIFIVLIYSKTLLLYLYKAYYCIKIEYLYITLYVLVVK